MSEFPENSDSSTPPVEATTNHQAANSTRTVITAVFRMLGAAVFSVVAGVSSLFRRPNVDFSAPGGMGYLVGSLVSGFFFSAIITGIFALSPRFRSLDSLTKIFFRASLILMFLMMLGSVGQVAR